MVRTLSFVLDGTPVPKGRPKSGKGRVYTPERTRVAEEMVAMLTLARREAPFDGDVQVLIEFRVKQWRGDLDNLAKLTLDGMATGGAIRNDRQVKRLTLEEIVSDAESTTVWMSDYVQRVE